MDIDISIAVDYDGVTAPLWMGRQVDEARTRREIIDKRLLQAGWDISDPSQVTLEFDIYLGTEAAADSSSPYAGHHFADYLLFAKDGSPLAVVEAKRTSKDAQLGKEQGLGYAKEIVQTQGCELPFVLYTNGNEIFFWDSKTYPPRRVHGFPTRDDLDHLRFLRAERRPLSVELINTDISGRPYQIEAIRTVLERVEKKHRDFLLVMATGTGKTRVCIGLMDVILRARWAKRVLFLVDRIALRDQARDAFKEHLPNSPFWPKPGEKAFAQNRRLYVTTYPTMLNIIHDESQYISPFFFDLIVADESHRSIYNTYKQILDYFYGLKLGLTATPTGRIDHDTFALFDCEVEDPTFAYTYEEAVENKPPYLCDFEVLRVRSKFQLEGIKGGVLPTTVQKKLIAEGKDVEDLDFEGTDLERKVTNAGTNRLIVREFMEECIKDSNGVLPGKTIFFAISKAHARRLQQIFDNLYPEHKGKLSRVIVSDDSRVHGKGGLMDQFKNQNMPRIAISVDMLDTGVDIREVVNLVFAKPVYSYTKFWQMIGRGTRILEEDPEKRRAWCPEKDKFLIIDCWGNFEFFQMNPKGREPGGLEPLPVKLFKARLDKLEAAFASENADIIESTKKDLQKELKALPQQNVVVLDGQEKLSKVKPKAFWQHMGVEEIGFLRSHIAPILRARSGADFKAMRFETYVVELSTAILGDNNEAYEALKETIIEKAGGLPLTVNIVAKQKELIEDVLGEKFWKEVDEERLQSLIERIAPLMKYWERRLEAMMMLDIGDLLAVKEWIEFGPEHERLTTKTYRQRVEAMVQKLVDENPILQKLKQGISITEKETQKLADLLRQQELEVTEERLRRVFDNKTAKFIQFIRHILGLERVESWGDTVASAFDQFITEHNTYTANQVKFIQTLRTFILQTGKVEKKDLVSAPFTQIHPMGIRGLFKASEIDEILNFAGELVA